MSNWVIETMIATTLLMLAVLALRMPVARLFGPRVAYLLWLAPALRMILPPLPQKWFPASAGTADAATAGNAAVVMAGVSSPTPIATVAAGGGTAWLTVSLAVWLGGAILFLGWHILAYRRFARRVRDGAEPLFEDSHIPVAASAAVSSPIALGIFGRTVIVPADFVHRFDAIEQRLALSHELTHHRRGDLPVNLAALAMLAIHWFNPIAHFAHRAFRLDQEAACDAVVLSGASASERHAYGTALFKSATGPVPLAACAMGTATQLKTRLRRILAASIRPEQALAGSAIALAAIGGGLLFTASVGSAAEPDATEIRGEADETAGDARAEEAERAARERAQEALEAGEQAAQNSREAEQDARDAEQEARDGAIEAEDAAREVQQEADGARTISSATMREAREAASHARAEAHRAMGEAHRALSDARRRMVRISASQTPPLPPVAPVAPHATSTTPAPLAPVAPTAPPARISVFSDGKAKGVQCPGKVHSQKIVARSENGNHVVVIDCDGIISAMTNARTTEALARARTQIKVMLELTKVQRAAALEGLDRALEKLDSKTFTLE